MNKKPYIGITDFTDKSQVLRMFEVFRAHKKPSSKRVLHVGVMTSFKVMNGLPTRFQDAFPQKHDISGIFPSLKPDLMNCLHYADYDHSLGVGSEICAALYNSLPNVSALQLDMIWPDPSSLEMVNGYLSVDVILQVNAKAMVLCNDDPKRVAMKVASYGSTITRVLLDKSMGRGLGLDAKELLPFARAIRDLCPKIGIGFAGGLGPDSLGLLLPLIQEFPDMSIDAQSKLRPSGSALDPIDWDMAEKYLIGALDLLA